MAASLSDILISLIIYIDKNVATYYFACYTFLKLPRRRRND
jgi:uncharacterized membrane protein YoaT (DUF817 family)